MKITFYGQLGLPRLREQDAATPENRVASLARQLVEEGHDVTVLGTTPYISAGNYHGISLKRIPSLNPEQPGGWLYLALGLLHMLFKQPDVIHVHTWPAAVLLTLTHWLVRNTRIVWTVDYLPMKPNWLHQKLLTTHYSLLTTTQRTLQYRLLVEYGVKAHYIPDGYSENHTPAMSLKHLKLKKDGYTLVFANFAKALRPVTKAYKASKRRQKMVVMDYERQTIRQHGGPAVTWRVNYKLTTPRLRRSLIANAATVIVAGNALPQTTLLQAMAAGKSVVSINDPLYQETLGTTGRYFKQGDAKGLAEILVTPENTKSGQAARKRARAHFTWARLTQDYHTLYAPAVRPVYLDSVHLVQPTLAAVR